MLSILGDTWGGGRAIRRREREEGGEGGEEAKEEDGCLSGSVELCVGEEGGEEERERGEEEEPTTYQDMKYGKNNNHDNILVLFKFSRPYSR